MFNLAFDTVLNNKYNIIKDIVPSNFTMLSSNLVDCIDAFSNSIEELFSATEFWSCSTKNAADNSISFIKDAAIKKKPDAERVGRVGPIVEKAIDYIKKYKDAYDYYKLILKSKPRKNIPFLNEKDELEYKINPAYSNWENAILSPAYNNVVNLAALSHTYLNNISECLLGNNISEPVSVATSLNIGESMTIIDETLSDDRIKRGYLVKNENGDVLREGFVIADKDGNITQYSLVSYNNEKNTKTENYTLYKGDNSIEGTREYDEFSHVTRDTYTDTNGNAHTVTNEYDLSTGICILTKEIIKSTREGKSVINENDIYRNGENAGETHYKVYYEGNPDEIIRSGTIDSEGIEHNSYVEKKVADISSSSSTDIETVEFAESNDDTSTEVTPPSISSIDDTSTEVTPPSTSSNDDTLTEVTPPGTSSNNGLSVDLTPTKSPSSSSTSVGPVSPSISSEPKTRDEIKSEILSTIDEKGMKLGDDLVEKITDDVYDNQGSNTGSTFISTLSTNTSVSPSTPVDPSEIYKFDGNFGGSKTRDEIRLEVLKDMYKLGVKPDEKLIDSQVEYIYNNQNN